MSSIIEYTKDNCPPHVTMGGHSYCYGEFRGSGNKVLIGRFCSIAQNTVFDCGFDHSTRMVSSFPFKNRFGGLGGIKSNCEPKGDIKIGHDVTIGEGCFIKSNVTIGTGAHVGCNSVVTKDIGPYEIWAGSPAKFIRLKFPYAIIVKLLDIEWWNKWPIEKVLENAHLLNGDDDAIYKFVEKYYER